MRELSFKFQTWLDFSQPVKEHDFLLRCLPQQLPEQQVVSMRLEIEPERSVAAGVFSLDCFGNRLYAGRISGQHTHFNYGVIGRVCRDDRKKVMSEPMGCFKYPTALTCPSPAMKDYLAQQQLEGSNYEIGQRLNSLIYEYFTYVPGSTGVNTTAAEAFAARQGVCQDYAHVFIALARLAGIPARYVSGLPEGEGVSHAWAEIWHEGLWYGFDPTRHKVADEGYIKLNVGRDYQDCPLERGIFRGSGTQRQTSFMQVKEMSQ